MSAGQKGEHIPLSGKKASDISATHKEKGRSVGSPLLLFRKGYVTDEGFKWAKETHSFRIQKITRPKKKKVRERKRLGIKGGALTWQNKWHIIYSFFLFAK